ncbi:MAG: hypothetical protein ACK526_17745 [Planctomyces sp.]
MSRNGAPPKHLKRARSADWVAAVILVALVSGIAGCGHSAEGPVYPISRFDVWKVPAEGRSLPAPRALYSDTSDNVYALDDAGRVLVYAKDGTLTKQWRMPAWDVGRPEGIWKMLDGRIAVADTHYHRVILFNATEDGTVSEVFGREGTGDGEFVFPVAVTQDPSGYLYVGEYGDKQRIQKFTSDGEYVTQFGKHGTAEGEFQRPSAVVWRDGKIYAVDAFNNRIQIFTDTGEFLKVLKLPDDVAPLEFPYDLTVTRDGTLFVIENKASRLTVLNQDGTILGRYGGPARGLNGFLNPWALTVLTDGRILVADTGNHRLVELTP